MREIKDLPNIGPKLAEQLINIGIHNDEDLKAVGSVEALLKLNGNRHEEGCLNKLYALEGAIKGVRWHDLERDLKQKRREAYYQKIGKRNDNCSDLNT